MSHADHHFLDADNAAGADQLVHGHDQRFAAFQRETLLADIAGMQVALQRFRRGQALEETLLVIGPVGRRGAAFFQSRLQPALLRHLGQMHVFGAHRPAIGLPHRLENLAQGGRLADGFERAGVEDMPQIGLGEAVVGGVEFRDRRPLLALQRIELRPAVAQEAVGIDQLQHLDLLFGILLAGAGRCRQGALLGALREGGNHRRVRHIGRRGVADARQGAQLVEIIAPGRLDRRRVVQVALVEFLDERRIGTEQVGIRQCLSHHLVVTSAGRSQARQGRLTALAFVPYRRSMVGTSRRAAPT